MDNTELQILETERGVFTNNEVTRQSAEEVYIEWLNDNFDCIDGEWIPKQIDNCLDQTKTNEQLTQENNQLWETVEFLLKNVDMIPKEIL